ncbi:hypothetical protein B0H66DRAFT_631840 [Apodospora peruviana]|uniref:PLD phosphodiesterase domain-containing protein n=1 Tax=Apodospora peruviana TaxID=516989 RepID=A0AAE0LZ53_9PEZI|nr:hypothetical protein B0H66DRAFT_631840 [Apodospora peruviana]
MSLLDQLEKEIAEIDKGGVLRGISYQKTWNESLGFPKTESPSYHVLIPYGKWPPGLKDELNAPAASVLEQAFKDVLSYADLSTAGKTHFIIDIAHLDNIINKLESQAPSVIPVVRFLVGLGHDKQGDGAKWESKESSWNRIFWSDNSGLVKNPKAEIYVGYYGPNFHSPPQNPNEEHKERKKNEKTELEAGATSVLQWANHVFGDFGIYLDKYPGAKEKLSNFSKYTPGIVASTVLEEGIAQTISCNHAKILAVNGSTMMTGGANFWAEYQAGAMDIIDTQAKIKGDATISAHNYCDYFWKYLTRTHPTDSRLFARMAKLNEKAPQWVQVSTKNPVPLFHGEPKATSGIPVLTVAKLGDWVGKMGELEYPVQIIDAVRDIALNLLLVILDEPKVTSQSSWVFYTLTNRLSDHDSKVKNTLGELGITPAVWASRYARVNSISKAQKTVHMSVEFFATWVARENSDKFRKTVDSINAELKPVANGRVWDGIMWPVAMFPKSTLNVESSRILACGWSSRPPIILVPTRGYEDRVSDDDLTKRLISVLTLMKTNAVEAETIVREKFHVKRVMGDVNGPRYYYNHSKVVCVDKKLLGMGSDNAYPSYNEEHTVWIEDGTAIDAWYKDYWVGLWDRSDVKETH